MKAMRIAKSSQGDLKKVAFVMKNQNENWIPHIYIPPSHMDIEHISLKYYQMKEVVLRKATKDMINFFTTIGLKKLL